MPTEEQIKEKLKTVKDPEIGLDIISLGLVYGVETTADKVKITMTLTSPMCPLGDTLLAEVKKALSELGATAAEVQLTFDPPWDTSKMSEAAKAELGVL